jgi:hypothetical protein
MMKIRCTNTAILYVLVSTSLLLQIRRRQLYQIFRCHLRN